MRCSGERRGGFLLRRLQSLFRGRGRTSEPGLPGASVGAAERRGRGRDRDRAGSGESAGCGHTGSVQEWGFGSRRPHLVCCAQGWTPQCRGLLERVRHKSTKVVNGLEHLRR